MEILDLCFFAVGTYGPASVEQVVEKMGGVEERQDHGIDYPRYYREVRGHA